MNVKVDDPLLFNPYREYYLYLPPNYTNTKPLPIVFAFHGFYDEAIDAEKTDKLMYVAKETRQLIVVHPQGLMDCGSRRCQVCVVVMERLRPQFD